MNQYTKLVNMDQNGRSIKKYTGDDQQCMKDCSSNNICQGTVTNGSNCWTINSFPSPYNKIGSVTYKKNAPTLNFNGYTTAAKKDQNGQTIKNYINDIEKCNTDCNSNPNCKGMIINGINCSTIKGFNEYNNPGSTTYKKIVYPTPTLTSSNFPTTSNNNLFSSVFCNNISTNNGFIQKNNTSLRNLPIYKSEKTFSDNNCLTKCKDDFYCSGYSFLKNKNDKNDLNCLLYNKVPTDLNIDNNINSGYKINNYNYNFNQLNSSQKNIIRKDCINNYFNNEYNTNLDYSKYYTIDSNNSKISFNADSLAKNEYVKLNKVKVLNNYNNIDTELINPITNKELDDFAKNYQGYMQSQYALLNYSNEKIGSTSDKYTEEINTKTDISSSSAQSNISNQTISSTSTILNSIGGTSTINESFENYNVKSNNIIKFYLYILIVIIFLFLIYYLKKKKYF